MILLCFYLGNIFKWINLQVEIVNKWLPDRGVFFGFWVFFPPLLFALIGETEHKLNHIVCCKKKSSNPIFICHLVTACSCFCMSSLLEVF